jgi:group I intron endonuclease
MPHVWNIVPDAEFFGFQVYSNNVPERRQGIYAVVHVDTDRPYVGMAGNVKCRVQTHSKAKGQKKFYNAVNEYGVKSFLAIPIYYSIIAHTRKELSKIETSLIQDYDAIKHGFNIKLKNVTGDLQQPEEKRRRSEAAKKVAASDPNFVKRLHAGRTSESEARRIESLKKTLADPAVKKRRSEVSIGKRWFITPEGRQYKDFLPRNASDKPGRPIGQKRTLKARKNMSESAKRISANPERKKCRSITSKQMWLNPEFRERNTGRKWFHTTKGTNYKANEPRDPSDILGRIWTPHRNPPGMRFFVMPSGTRYLSIEPRDPLDKPLKKSRTV